VDWTELTLDGFCDNGDELSESTPGAFPGYTKHLQGNPCMMRMSDYNGEYVKGKGKVVPVL
jgi:hypothetical protein